MDEFMRLYNSQSFNYSSHGTVKQVLFAIGGYRFAQLIEFPTFGNTYSKAIRQRVTICYKLSFVFYRSRIFLFMN